MTLDLFADSDSQQLLLPLQPKRSWQLSDLPDSFAAVRHALAQWRNGGSKQLHLCGEPGSGCSLLLSAVASELGSQAVLLPLREVVFMPPEMLEGIEHYPYVLLDDLDALRDFSDWQEALFHLYNRMQWHGGRLLVSARVPPAQLPLSLADLRSRLSRAVVHHLPAPDDQTRSDMLARWSLLRNWPAQDEVGHYLIQRGPRRLGQFQRLLERLDAHSLRTKKPLSAAMVRELLVDNA